MGIKIITEEERRDPKEVAKEAKIAEYIQYVKAEQDNIGLLGYLPNLRKIRKAYKSGIMNGEVLEQVVAALVNKYEGYYAQPYNNIKEFFEYLKPGLVAAPVERDLTDEQSRDIIAALLEKHDPKRAEKAAKKRKQRLKRKVKKPSINVAALPAHLQGLV